MPGDVSEYLSGVFSVLQHDQRGGTPVLERRYPDHGGTTTNPKLYSGGLFKNLDMDVSYCLLLLVSPSLPET